MSTTVPTSLSATDRRQISADSLMKLCIGVATVLGFYLAWQKYHYFNGDTNDLTVFAYAFSHTLHGKFLPTYFADGCLLGCHVNWVILAWLPVYAVWRSFYSLLFFQSLMLTISAWPFYLLAKHVLKNERAALALGITFLLFPTIASQHVNQIHDDQFALPFLVFAFYFFVREDFRRFVLMMVLGCLAKESMTLTTAAFGLYALLQRRSWKWVVVPIVFSGLYLGFAIFLLRHVFPGMGAPVWEAAYHLGMYGKTYPEIAATFVTRPGFVLQTVFSRERVEYLGQLLLPLLYVLPWLSAAVLVSLPNLLLNLVVPNMAFTVIAWHYNIILGATLLAASVFGIKRIADRFGKRRDKVAVGLAAAMALLSLFGMKYWYRSEDYEPKPYDAALRRALAAVPPNASVMCPTPMLAHLADQPKVLSAYSLLVIDKRPERLAEFDYIILDGNWRNYEAIGQVQLVQLFNQNPQWQQRYRTVLHEQNVWVLQRMR